MELRPLVEQYLKLAGEFGRPVALEEFRLSREETESQFSAWDEDYLISRFLHLTRQEGAAEFSINGFLYTHIALESGVLQIL
jgi:hypothetical protein